jgi:homospermidine synthase
MVELLITDGENVKKQFLKTMGSSGKNLIAILSSKSYSVYKNDFNKVCTGKNCLFIDTVMEEKDGDVIFIPPTNLTALSIAINQAQQSFSGKVSIIFDSVSGLSVANNPQILIKFLLFIINKSRDWGSNVFIIVARDALPKDLLELLKQSTDNVRKI